MLNKLRPVTPSGVNLTGRAFGQKQHIYARPRPTLLRVGREGVML